jgi:phage gp36-like protein
MYITLGELKIALGENEKAFSAIISDDEFAEIITNRDSFIDEFIGGTVALPFSTVPKLIIYISTKLCVYDVFAENAPDDVSEVVKDGKIEAMRLLDKIVAKKIPLGSQVDDDGDNVNVLYSVDNQVFTSNL